MFTAHASPSPLDPSLTTMPYLPNTDADQRAMLEAIGAGSIDDCSP